MVLSLHCISFYYLETYFKIIINILKIILSRYILNKTRCIRKKLMDVNSKEHSKLPTRR